MVSSGKVTSDLGTFDTTIGNYQTNFEGISASWKGDSYNSLSSKVEQFISEYKSAIDSQMTAFAAAVAAYESYMATKSSLSTAKSNYSQAEANKDSGAMSKYSSEISSLESQLENLKKEIESYLSKASSPSLSATSVSSDVSTSKETSTTTNLRVSGSEIVQSVLTKAYEIADDNKHGYSQEAARRWGSPDYDCSSFVITCWENAGTGVKEAGASYTGNMKDAFLSTGLFEWIPGNPSVSDLQPGDVLLNPGSHTELYIGDGKMIGARHGDRDERRGDSSGKEICVTDLARKWQGVLRYTGGKSGTTTSST